MKAFLGFITFLFLTPGILFAQADEESDTAEINVKNADIAAVVRIFSRKTKRNYILDERVKGKVSIYLPGKIPANESQRILDAVLHLKGFTSVPVGENLWKVVPAKDAIQTTIPTVRNSEDTLDPTAAMVTRLFQLKYVGADAAQELIQPLVSSSGLINAYTGTNSLILIDSADNIERLVDIIDSLDVPATDQELIIIPIEHADAIDIADKLTEILTSQEADESQSTLASRAANIRARLRDPGQPPTGGGAAPATSSATVRAQSREPKIIADERTNSIILVADEDTAARIRALISQLDSEVDRSGFRFYVYRCQHVSAEEVAEVLSALGGGGSSGGISSTSSSQSSRSASQSSSQSRLASQRRTPGQSRSSSNSASATSSTINSAAFGDEVSITADPSTNALIIYSGKTDYQKIVELLEQLDVKRKQVLVEAMLLEVTIDDSITMSTEFLASGGGADGGVFAQSAFSNNLATLITDPTQLSNFTVAAATAGSLTIGGDDNGLTIPSQSILLNAAQNNSNVNVLSAPNILATDNEPAEIVVGSNVPFISSTSTSGDNLNNTFNTVDRQDVGITLRLTPQISSNDTVRLDIFTEVSNVVDSTADSELGPTTTIRTSETTAITKDSQTVVIGGLMSDEVSEVDTGIPFLKDVPLLGHLFRSSIERANRTNLLIFITPRIIKDQFDHRDSTIERRDKVRTQMERDKVYPGRDDVLFDEGIDSVAQMEEFEGEKPSQITAIRASRMKRSGEQFDAPRIKGDIPTDEDTIELRIKPKFPTSSSRGARYSGDQFIVLDVIRSDSSMNVPFLPSGNRTGKKVVIKLPSGSAPGTRAFFEAGANYRYGDSTTLKALGAFNDISEVQELFPDVASPYTPSPHEIMNLGRGPWKKGA